jgi:hypothetical protein
MFLFCRSWIALTSFRRERGLMVFFPLLNLLIVSSASFARRDRHLVENCFAAFLQVFRVDHSFVLAKGFVAQVQGSRFGHHR